jgi:aspartate racemase
VASVTPHLFLGPVRAASPLPVLDLVEATVAELVAAGHRTVGLLGTRLTLTRAFFLSGLERAGIRVVVPDEAGIAFLDALIFGPLASGQKSPDMRQAVSELTRKMAARDTLDALVVACTDLMDLVEPTAVLVDPIDCHIRLAARTLTGLSSAGGAAERSPEAFRRH